MNDNSCLLHTGINNHKHFTNVRDVTSINALVASALSFKKNPKLSNIGATKKMGLIFLNPSLRTRLSTQIAAENLGMQPIVFNVGSEGWQWEFAEGAIMNGTTVEHIKDAAPILGSYFDVLAIRTFPGLKNREDDYSEHIFSQFIKYVNKPVISLESATVHPLQSLADCITITELTTQQEKKAKVVLTWAPHIKSIPQCVANSFSEWMVAWQKEDTSKFDFVITHPKGYELSSTFTEGATITHNQDEALKDADFVYVKNWSRYENYGTFDTGKQKWMLTKNKIAAHTKVMHCLPVRRNIELSDEILDSTHSLVTHQASNRVWSAQAVLNEILK